MFSHVTLGSSDIARSRRFYDALLGALGVEPSEIAADNRLRYFRDGAMLTILEPIDGNAPSPGNGTTIGFRADSPAQADAWVAAGVAHGGTLIEDAPGPRERPIGTVYLAYLRDPDGNKLCAFHRMAQ